MPNIQAPKLRNSWVEHPLVCALKDEFAGVRSLMTYWAETVRARREQELYLFLEKVAEAINSLQ